MATDPRISLADAAERLGVHYMTAYRYVRTGLLPAEKIGRRWLVDPADLAALRTTSPPHEGRRSLHPDRLTARLLVGDEAGAWQLVESALVAGASPEELLLDLVAPAMAEVGARWEAGTARIVEEHRATATAGRLIARLGPRFAVRGEPIGTVLVGAAPGDHHGLPSAILRDLVRGRNLDAVDLGADVPVASWAEAAQDLVDRDARLVAVAIGAMAVDLDHDLDHDLADAIDAVRAVASVPILLGGAAIADDAHAHRLGADARTTSLRDALEQIAGVAAELR